jgi:hypothetical protein
VLSVARIPAAHADYMKKTTHLNAIGRSAAGQPRTYRHQPARSASRGAAYRRLAVTILGLDVATLVADLRTTRLGQFSRLQAA